jgi:hypothetical protein
MDSLILLSWLAYFCCSLLLLLASWKLLFWLPFSLRAGVFLSQLAVLLMPARVDETAWAPAFIVLALDMLAVMPPDVLIGKALPLMLALVMAWPLALLWSWSRTWWLARRVAAVPAPAQEQQQ